jgi:hypothetical protein
MPEPISPLDKLSTDFEALAKEVTSTLSTWKGNFLRNSKGAFNGMSPKQWIRLTVIVCAYLLLRPYLLKLGAKVQERQMEKAARESAVDPDTKINANYLRGGAKKIDIPGVDSDSEEEAKGEQWGRKARLRQRKVVKRAMEIHEQNLRDKGNESDKDIEDLLED